MPERNKAEPVTTMHEDPLRSPTPSSNHEECIHLRQTCTGACEQAFYTAY